MPKTRNVTRSQWDAAKTSTHTSTTRKTSSRKRNENENNNGYDSEKENSGRQAPNVNRLHSSARARARAGLGVSNPNIPVLGAITTNNGKVAGKAKTASKGKGVPPPAPVKRKKMPLEDITAEFLPAPEALNRDEPIQPETVPEDAPGQNESAINVVVTTAPVPETLPSVVLSPPKFNSPLPPSSPPSELTQSPSFLPEPTAPQFHDNFDASSNYSIPQATLDPWQEFDEALPSHDDVKDVSSNSDPFGFVALERKLKADREAALLLAPDRDFEDADHLLEADTSSPRPIRRLKRPSLIEEDVEDQANGTEVVIPHPHFVTPPTPHKDQHKRRRMSHAGHDVFSPCSSSVESSPSPTKVSSVRKRPQPDMADDPLDEYNEEVDRSYALEQASKKAKVDEAEDRIADTNDNERNIHLSNSILRSLRPREKRRSLEDMNGDNEHDNKRSKTVKSHGAKKPSSKSRSAATKKEEKEQASDEEDLDARWQKEREERIEYFKRLEDYQVEKEDVFLI